jgi:hypothetical protein
MQTEAMNVANIKKAMKEHRFTFQFGSPVHNGSGLSLRYANMIVCAERCYLLPFPKQQSKQKDDNESSHDRAEDPVGASADHKGSSSTSLG